MKQWRTFILLWDLGDNLVERRELTASSKRGVYFRILKEQEWAKKRDLRISYTKPEEVDVVVKGVYHVYNGIGQLVREGTSLITARRLCAEHEDWTYSGPH